MEPDLGFKKFESVGESECKNVLPATSSGVLGRVALFAKVISEAIVIRTDVSSVKPISGASRADHGF